MNAQYEYDTIEASQTCMHTHTLPMLNKMGKEGWEVVAVLSKVTPTAYTILLKRIRPLL